MGSYNHVLNNDTLRVSAATLFKNLSYSYCNSFSHLECLLVYHFFKMKMFHSLMNQLNVHAFWLIYNLLVWWKHVWRISCVNKIWINHSWWDLYCSYKLHLQNGLLFFCFFPLLYASWSFRLVEIAWKSLFFMGLKRETGLIPHQFISK